MRLKDYGIDIKEIEKKFEKYLLLKDNILSFNGRYEITKEEKELCEYVEGNIEKINSLCGTFKEQVVNNLKYETRKLNEKLQNLRKENNFGMYKNLITAYSEILRLIDRHDWHIMYSEYGTDVDNKNKQIAVWEQNSDNLIRNHKVWNVLKCKKAELEVE
jgi:hypothetical protein